MTKTVRLMLPIVLAGIAIGLVQLTMFSRPNFTVIGRVEGPIDSVNSFQLDNGNVAILTNRPGYELLFDAATREFVKSGSVKLTCKPPGTLLVGGRAVQLYPPNGAAVLRENGCRDIPIPRDGEDRILVLNDGQILLTRSGKLTLSDGKQRRQLQATSHSLAEFTVLQSGDILSTGGAEPKAIATASVIDKDSGRLKWTGQMHTPRFHHMSVLLNNGEVLVAGGYTGRGEFTETAELFNPVTRTFTNVGNLCDQRIDATAFPLGDSDALIVGGTAYRLHPVLSCELFRTTP